MIRLRTFGNVQLDTVDATSASAVLAQPKRLAVLAYLALARPRGPKRRDTLLALFWPELDEPRARHALSQTLHFLRRKLGHDVVTTTGPEDVAVASVASDVIEFEQAIERGDDQAALELYAGEFLSGFHLHDAPEFEHWIDGERTRLRACATGAAHGAAERAVAAGRRRESVTWAARAVELDALNERAVRRLMRAQDAAGDRSAALRAYREFEARLRAELDAQPSPETQELAQTIRARSEPTKLSSGDMLRWVQPAPVDVPTDAPPAAAPPIVVRRFSWRMAAVGASLVAVAGASLAISRAGAVDPVPVSLVVLPFADMGAAGTDEYLGDGMTEDLTTILSQARGLRVTARTSAFAYKGKGIDVREIGRVLDVGNVLEGSVRRHGDSIRVTAQLIDAATGYHRWSEAFDRPAREVLAVQGDIARGVTEALQVPFPAAMSMVGTTANPDAYEAYLRGRYLLRNRTRARVGAAIDHFQRAITLDSGYARAYAGLSDAYIQLTEYVRPRDILPMARRVAERAVRLDSANVEARLAMADLLLIHDRNWHAAEREYRAAIRLDGRAPLALERYARFLSAARRFDEHVAVTKEALALRSQEPREAVERAVSEHTTLAAAYFAAQRYEEALDHGERALQLDPSSWAVNAVIGRTYVELGRYDEAIAALEIAWPASQQLPALTRLGYAYGRAGRTEDARRVLARLRAIADTTYLPKDQIALVHLGLGDRDGAIAALWQAYEERHWWLPWINQSPPFDALRPDARYMQLLRELGAP